MKRFAANLRSARMRHGISMRALSKELGKSPPYICLVEQEAFTPNPDTIRDIAKILRVSTKGLIGA